MAGSNEKKKFDKKAYRTKRYDNKAKLADWKEKRKVAMQHKYKKMLKKEGKTGQNVIYIYKQFETTQPSSGAAAPSAGTSVADLGTDPDANPDPGRIHTSD
jgi:hypothetical protein